MLQIPELLSPAGDLERLRYAVCYGADAVYCGMTEFGMRSAPANFTPGELAEGVIFAHARGKKVYLTLNSAERRLLIQGLLSFRNKVIAKGIDTIDIDQILKKVI